MITVRTGREWRVSRELDAAESRLRHKVMVGTVACGRAELSSFPMPNYSQTQCKVRRYLVQVKVIVTVEEIRISRVTGMRQRGAWMSRKVQWNGGSHGLTSGKQSYSA